MPLYYMDSTALVKRYSRERGTSIVNTLIHKSGKQVVVGTPSVLELYAVLALKTRQGEITRDDWYSLIVKFECEAAQGLFQQVAPTAQTYVFAKELIVEHPTLTATQALHLALAGELKPHRVTLVTCDRELLELCRPHGLTPSNPEED